MISFLTCFTYCFIVLCYTFICRTDTRVKCCFVSGFVYHFTYHFIIVSNIVSPIYMFEYTVYIVDIELYGSLARLETTCLEPPFVPIFMTDVYICRYNTFKYSLIQ